MEPLLNGGQGGDSARIVADLRTVERSVRNRWPMPLERRQKLQTILMQIAETDVVEVEKLRHEKGEGERVRVEVTESVKGPNHRNQVAAARVLVLMEAQNQGDDHHADKLAQDDKHLAVSWADTLAKAPPEELIAAAIRLGLVEKLPPVLREQAKARMK